MKQILLTILAGLSLTIHATPRGYVGGFNLTENGTFVYDAAEPNQMKTPAQVAVDRARELGTTHINLNMRAKMVGPYSNEIIPNTEPAERANELTRVIRLIKYIHSQGMTVGIRPIFFVVGPNGEFPYKQRMPDGTIKDWWHGNIQPSDPNRWFESFRVYLDLYITIAKFGKADEFTVGAELYSMTVGIEDQWSVYPYGFPGRWLELLRYVRSKLPNTRLMYDINFTDDSVKLDGGLTASGGELERWRYRIADLANPTDPAQLKIWQDLTAFWTELDAVGIDMYRSLAADNDVVPSDYNQLVATLKIRSNAYADQLNNTLTQIGLTLNHNKLAILKEVGFRSVERGFINPFNYTGSGSPKVTDQAAAYEAVFDSFWKPNWPWFKGIIFWEIPLDPSRRGTADNGFSPLDKPQTEAVIKSNFLP